MGTHYHDMLRIAISIYKGKIKASTVLRKFCSKSRKNKLYFALRELGRVERTIFLLNYINDAEMRSQIQAATDMSPYWTEHLNRFGIFSLDMNQMAQEIEYDLQTPDI